MQVFDAPCRLIENHSWICVCLRDFRYHCHLVAQIAVTANAEGAEGVEYAGYSSSCAEAAAAGTERRMTVHLLLPSCLTLSHGG